MFVKLLKILWILLVAIQIGDFKKQKNSTDYKTISNEYINYFNKYDFNETKRNNSWIGLKGLTNLLRDIGLKSNNNGTIIKQNITLQCFTPKKILKWFNGKFTQENLRDVCPILLTQISSRVCRPPHKEQNVKNNLEIWLYSFGAVLVCSLVGLVVVWLIPMMPKLYYNSITQLLIALAVGSLAGDALLHLIPHAIMDDGKGGHSHNKHNKMVWKSLVALIGIHLFFITERITILRQNFQSKRKLKAKHLSQENSYSELSAGDNKLDDSEKVPVKNSENKALSAGKLHWAAKSRKYSGSSRELVHASSHMGINGEVNIGSHLCNRPKSKPHVNSDCPDSMNFELCNTVNPYSMNQEYYGGNSNNSDVRQINGEIKTSNNVQPSDETKTHSHVHDPQVPLINNTSVPSIQKDTCNWSNNEDYKLLQPSGTVEGNSNNTEVKYVSVAKQAVKDETVEIGAGGATVKSSLAHPFKNKPHGHHHGHSHDLSSVKAIAYTVIAGDGLHNFCDGIAIGAAFANDIRGGLSTAIAVLCHELPHELGDFVVLLHAGMSIRTAIFYNLMSSIFCALGMVIGVQLGKLPTISSWVFMLTAGMFLYIALVDMMPELSTRRLKGKKFCHRPSILFLWQNIGFLIGAAIMLMIALYEESMF